jgi:hypothetical protein
MALARTQGTEEWGFKAIGDDPQEYLTDAQRAVYNGFVASDDFMILDNVAGELVWERLRKYRKVYVEHQHATRRRRVDALGQRHQTAALFFEFLRRGDQLLQRPGKPVEFPHHQHVTLA